MMPTRASTASVVGSGRPATASGALTVSALPGRGRFQRRYLVHERGTKAHVFGKALVSTGPIARCGRVGGRVASYREVEDREVCAGCLAKV